MRHLCSTQPSGAARHKLLGITRDGGHLLVVTSASYSNMEMLVRPLEEWYCACAAWGDTTTYNSRAHSVIAPDAEIVAAALRGKFDQSSTQWTAGHKSLFAYYARSGCPARCSTSTPTAMQILRTLEFGSSRSLFKFNLKYLPFKSWPTRGVYLRVHHPGFVVGSAYSSEGFDYSHNGSANLSYFFSSSKPTTGALDSAQTFGQCIFTEGNFANEGHMSQRGEFVGYGKYDAWHTPLNLLSYSNVFYYYGQRDFYSDHEITNPNVIAQMCECIGNGGDVYLTVGPRIVNGISSTIAPEGLQVGYTATSYATRVELVFRLSGSVNS